nr:nudix hydrolase 2-like [Ipomoea batatas]
MAGKQQEGGIAPPVFEAAEDAYGGVTVELSEWSMDSGDFVTVLRASLSQWRHQGKKGVWMKLSIQLACFVDAAVKEGFWFHHAEATYLMLVYWIPNTPHTIPSNASHRVGIGAFVINQTGQVYN